MFRFFYEKLKIKSPLINSPSDVNNLHNNDIIKNGLNETCTICVKVVELFNTIYGAASGNMCLLTIPTGGLYLLGGLSLALEKDIVNKDTYMVIK